MSAVAGADRDLGAAGVPETAKRPSAVARWRGAAALLITGLAVVVAPLALAVGITANAATLGPATARVVTAAEMEQDYGLKVDLVAVIAAGGVVDVRFHVVDAAKVGHLFHDAPPALYVESSGAVLRANTPKAHKMTVVDGASYFILYPNSGGVIQSGTQVSVVIDQIRLTPVVAQS
ncbi:MAG: hypothetical protein U0838_11855 [Chloroflexota bacterium]